MGSGRGASVREENITRQGGSLQVRDVGVQRVDARLGLRVGGSLGIDHCCSPTDILLIEALLSLEVTLKLLTQLLQDAALSSCCKMA